MSNQSATAGFPPLLEVENLRVVFHKRGFLGQLQYSVRAVNDVNFQIRKGETFGLVGESGSGKSTIGRAILRLIEPESGSIRFDGQEVTRFGRRTPLTYRRDVQVVFQNPYSSLNPSHVAEEIVGEPITRHFGVKGKDRRQRVVSLLEQVGLSAYHTERYPYEFSGGQRQRIAIARALAAQPKLIVCDEPVSALDVSTQAQVINLLEELQAELGVSLLFIGHDLSVVRHISDTVGVMYLGSLVETGPSDRIYEQPAHPYTQALLAAIPVADPVEQRKRREIRQQLRAKGEAPSVIDVPKGCPFQTRCSLVLDICREEMPALTPAVGGGEVRCHLHTSGPKLGGQAILRLVGKAN